MYFNKVKLDYPRSEAPTDIPHIGFFNGSFRDECLNMNWFMSLEDARDRVERWRKDYNELRPHISMKGKPVETILHGKTISDNGEMLGDPTG